MKLSQVCTAATNKGSLFVSVAKIRVKLPPVLSSKLVEIRESFLNKFFTISGKRSERSKDSFAHEKKTVFFAFEIDFEYFLTIRREFSIKLPECI